MPCICTLEEGRYVRVLILSNPCCITDRTSSLLIKECNVTLIKSRVSWPLLIVIVKFGNIGRDHDIYDDWLRNNWLTSSVGLNQLC